jgi:hypothetical protein
LADTLPRRFSPFLALVLDGVLACLEGGEVLADAHAVTQLERFG